MEGEDLRRAVGAVNDPTRLLKGSQNVVPCIGFQAFERQSLSHTRSNQTFVSEPGSLGGLASGGRPAGVEANTSGSISSVGPVDRLTARSSTSGSMGTAPGDRLT